MLGLRNGLVMVSRLRDMDCVFGNLIDKSVFIGNSSRPVTRKSMFQWFWFADALKGILFCLTNKGIDTSENFFISLLPKKIILPCIVGEDELQSISSFSVPFPSSSWVMDSIKRLVFVGDRKR